MDSRALINVFLVIILGIIALVLILWLVMSVINLFKSPTAWDTDTAIARRQARNAARKAGGGVYYDPTVGQFVPPMQ